MSRCNVTDELVEAIQNNTYQSDTLELIFGKRWFVPLVTAIKKNTTIKKFDLDCYDEKADTRVLVDSLNAQSERKIELRLSYSFALDHGIAALKGLTALDVGYINGVNFDAVKSVLSCPTLLKLNLSGNDLEDGVLKLFKNNRTLVELDLSDNSLTGKDLQYVTDISTLETLKLGSNFLKNDSLRVLKGNQSLRVLNLKSNARVGDNGLLCLADTGIAYLDLFDLMITDEGLDKFLSLNQQF